MKTNGGERRAALGELLLAWLASLLVFRWPAWGVWILAAGIGLWVYRRITSATRWRWTGLEPYFFLFMITAGVGVWAAYDSSAAWIKLLQLAAGCMVFLTLAGQPRHNLLPAGLLFGSLGSLAAVWFALTHDWLIQPADVGWLNRLGIVWMEIRPAVPGQGLFPNFVGGWAAVLLPVVLAFGWQAWSGQQRAYFWLSIATAPFLLVGLLLTSSRAAWAALIVAAALAAAALLATAWRRRIAPRMGRGWLLGSGLLLVSLFVVGVALIASRGLVEGLAGRLFAEDSAISRLAIARQTLYLIDDFPFTGAGLHAFPGLYSHYVMVNPNYIFDYSHNLYLDVALEQGVLGLAALLAIYAGAMWRIWRTEEFPALRWGLATALIVILLHGLVDDSLYGGQGTGLLFLVPGLAVTLHQAQAQPTPEPARRRELWSKNRRLFTGLIILLAVGLPLAFWPPLLSRWRSNLGAVAMARIDLEGFPSHRWNEGQNAADYLPVEIILQHALEGDPQNCTALYRLGLIEMVRRDFESASERLADAHQLNPMHRGVQKTLGYNQTWLGDYRSAATLLAEIPEAGSEMEVYFWWWGTQSRPDLAEHAQKMAVLLGSIQE